MGKTISEKILSNHSGKDAYAGEIVIANVDFVMGQDGTTPLAIKALEEMKVKKVWNPGKICLVIDHSVPSPNQGVSNLHTMMRTFTKEKGVEYLYDVGNGVCHQLVPEQGHALPGNLIVGADSHTTTYGALNVFSTGIGSTDTAAVFASGKIWLKVPETLKLVFNGKLPKGVYSKDISLHIIGDNKADGATYMAVEYVGETISNLSVDARMVITNMAVEMGAKAGIMEADDKTKEWLKKRTDKGFKTVEADDDAEYAERKEYDVSDLEPMIAKPHTVDNVSPISGVVGTSINQAFLGTCTNGRLEDLQIAADIMKGKKVHDGVRLVVAPASRQIYLDAIKSGVLSTLINAGAAIVTPGCGCCVGTHNGIPSDNEVVISSANRNFKGRMGNSTAEIYLGSPATVAASALKGEITDPREVL